MLTLWVHSSSPASAHFIIGIKMNLASTSVAIEIIAPAIRPESMALRLFILYPNPLRLPFLKIGGFGSH